MAGYSRFWLRMLPLRHRWPLPSLGPIWLEDIQPASRVLYPCPPSNNLFDRVAQNMERQVQEMEKMSNAFFQAWEHGKAKEDGVAPANDTGTYRFAVDASGFSPEEVTVKLDGRKLTVTAVREKESGGEEGTYWRERQELRRETLLPPDVDLQAVACSLASDGRLSVEAPRLTPTEKTIPIDIKPDKNQHSSDGEKEPGEKPKEP
nr:heat shock protein beta-9-like [Anolis sagrei ordinatus]